MARRVVWIPSSTDFLREAVLLFGLHYAARYRDAGCPDGRTFESPHAKP